MKKIILLPFIGMILNGCILSYANKNIYEMKATTIASNATSIKKEITGSALILSVLPTGEEPDIKPILLNMMEENNCKTLENIELEYYQKSYLIVGFPTMEIEADCIK